MAEKTGNFVAGRVFRWAFDNGPTAAKTYEHAFSRDGTVVFKDVSGGAADTRSGSAPARYAEFEIAPDTYLVSYMSDHGYTLTVAMNVKSKELHGFASGAKDWYPVEGKVEEVK